MKTIKFIYASLIGNLYFALIQCTLLWWCGLIAIIFSVEMLNQAFMKDSQRFLFWGAGAFMYIGSNLMIKHKRR